MWVWGKRLLRQQTAAGVATISAAHPPRSSELGGVKTPVRLAGKRAQHRDLPAASLSGKERDTVEREVSGGRESQNQRHCESTLSRWRNVTYADKLLATEIKRAILPGWKSGDRREDWLISRAEGQRVGSAALPAPTLSCLSRSPAQNGRSSSSASSASGKSSNASLPLGAAAPAATLLGAEKASAPSPLPDSRISSRPLISVV